MPDPLTEEAKAALMMPERVWLWDRHEAMTYSLNKSAWGLHEYIRADLAARPVINDAMVERAARAICDEEWERS